jgi:hypothetical protein
MNTLELINKHLNAAKTHAAIITYTDGSVSRVECNSEAAANNHISSYVPLIGKHEYTSRSTGGKIKIASCEAVAL